MLEEQILLAKGKNWVKLVKDRADKLCEIKKDETDLMIQILNGDIFNQAVEQIALEIKSGIYDKMLIPKENNL